VGPGRQLASRAVSARTASLVVAPAALAAGLAVLLAAPGGATTGGATTVADNLCVADPGRTLRCPDLVMKRPADVYVSTEGGRRLLRSENSIDNIGAGPAELDAVRRGRGRRMAARQRIRMRGGGSILVGGRARVVWKPIPGQSGYWKWEHAARMEVWKVDGAGRLLHRLRRSPKLYYCLRDLFRTRPRRPGSPRRRVYPGCSQDPNIRRRVLGTSVGWSDVYPSHYFQQYVDVTGLRGRVALVHVADPDDVLMESNEDNNTSRVLVSLPSGRVVGR